MRQENTVSEKMVPVEHIPKRPLILGGDTGILGPALRYTLQSAGSTPLTADNALTGEWNSEAWCRYVERMQPDIVINALCSFDVQRAEQEPSKAYFWNKELPCIVARALRRVGVGLVSFSSDCVFDGRQQVPYTVGDHPNPLSVYGQSFLAGERALQDSGLSDLLIIRSSWLFGPFSPNFVDWVLFRGKESQCLQVEHDQIGSPTYTLDLAGYALQLITHRVTGIHHVCNSGQASWCELAAETLSTCGFNCTVQAVTSSGSKAKLRPHFSVLDPKQSMALARIKPRPWPKALREYIFRFHSEHIAQEETPTKSRC